MGIVDFKKEMRMFTRFPLAMDIIFTVIARTDVNIAFPQTTEVKSGGITINVSQGGLCMVTEQELEVSGVIRIDLPLKESFLSAPTLLHVKWVNSLGNRFQVGLAYLF